MSNLVDLNSFQNILSLKSLAIARNLTDAQITEIENQCSEITNIFEWASEFNVNPYKGVFWSHENYENWLLYALHAHQILDSKTGEEKLTANQVASVFFQYAVVDQFIHRTQTVQAVKESSTAPIKHIATEPARRAISIKPEWISVNDVRFKKFLIQLIRGTEHSERYTFHFQHILNVEIVADLIIKNLSNNKDYIPRSELCLFLVDGVENIESHSNLLKLFDDYCIAFTGNIKINNKKFFVIPTFTILEIFFKILSSNYATSLDPVIGNASTKDVEDSRNQNKRLVSLSMKGIPILDMADGYWAGKAGSIIHDACFHTFKINSLSPLEKDALTHVIYNLLDPFISESQKYYNAAISNFFKVHNIDKKLQGKIKKYLKISNHELDNIVSKSLIALSNNIDQNFIAPLIGIQGALLKEIRPSIRNDLFSLKVQALRLRAAKRFRWLLIDGDLWSNLLKEPKKTWNPLFSHKSLTSLFFINPNMFYLIFNNMLQLSEFWWHSFEITQENYEMAYRLDYTLRNLKPPPRAKKS